MTILIIGSLTIGILIVSICCISILIGSILKTSIPMAGSCITSQHTVGGVLIVRLPVFPGRGMVSTLRPRRMLAIRHIK
jgi:hypothetical protein